MCLIKLRRVNGTISLNCIEVGAAGTGGAGILYSDVHMGEIQNGSISSRARLILTAQPLRLTSNKMFFPFNLLEDGVTNPS